MSDAKHAKVRNGLTEFCAGDSLFAHDERLDVWVPAGRPTYVYDGHQLVCDLWTEELQEPAGGRDALVERLEDFLVRFLLQKRVVCTDNQTVEKANAGTARETHR